MDVEVDDGAATIDCVAVDPDHQRAGLGSALLNAALQLLPATVCSLDAWTREDPAALNWYAARGFTVQFEYLHVYKNGEESADGFVSPTPLSPPVLAFCHAPVEHEAELRSRYGRVYRCRQFLRGL